MKVRCEVDPNTGRVLSQNTHFGDPVDGQVYCDAVIQGECYATSHGDVIKVPAAPSLAHTWDWASKSWVLPLSAAKDAKWSEVKAARDAREFGIFRWNGYDFDGDLNAQRRLTTALIAAQAALASGAPFSQPWKLADNSVTMLSAQDVVDVFRACGEHNIRDNHAQAAAKYALIQAATTIEALDSI